MYTIECHERFQLNNRVADLDKSRMAEYARRAAEDTARYNAALNREKKEDRR